MLLPIHIYFLSLSGLTHEGHLNIIRQGRKYGEVIVGVLTDEAMIRFNRFPAVSFRERVAMVRK